MKRLLHLTLEGWREVLCAESERIETWRIEMEEHGTARITRWAHVWHSETVSAEERKALRERFPFPDQK